MLDMDEIALPILLVTSVVLCLMSFFSKARTDDKRGGVKIHLPPSPSPVMERAADAVRGVTYNPPLWAALGGNICTVVGNVIMKLRTFGSQRLDITRTFVPLADGATVGLDWVTRPAAHATAPPEVVVIIQHGICGSTESVYVQELLHMLASRQPTWQTVVKLARGCGGTKLTSPMGFTATRTSDFASVVQHIAGKFPSARLVAVGFSLGSTLLGKYAGEHGAQTGLHAAVMLGPSWDFNVEGRYLNWPFGGWSANFLIHALRRYIHRHSEAVGQIINMEKASRSRTVREFDEICILTTHSYTNVEEYYADASPCRKAHCIELPTLAVSAADDPVCNIGGIKSIPRFGKGLMIAETPTGGHIMWPDRFGSKICIDFLTAVLDFE